MKFVNIFSRSILLKVVVLVVLLAIIVFTLLILVNSHWQRVDTMSQIESQGYRTTDLVELNIEEPMLIGDNQGTHQQFARIDSLYDDLSVYLTDFRGNITYSTDENILRRDLDEVHPEPGVHQVVFDSLDQETEESAMVTAGDETYFMTVRSIPNEPECYHCHGSSQPILGSMLVMQNINPDLALLQRHQIQNALLGLGCLLILVFFLVYFLKKTVINRITYLHEMETRVSKGELDLEFRDLGQDELGRLNQGFKEMVQNLKQKISESQEKTKMAEEQTKEANLAMEEAAEARDAAQEREKSLQEAATQVQSIAHELTQFTEQLAAQVEQASRGAEEQSRRTTETATSMEEMNATVLEVAQNASKSAEEATQAQETAKSGENTVHEAVKAIATVQRNALGLKKQIATLGEQAEGIGKIMNVIDDIADQTNLLALNAAIEAARAGDAGRGFAVVADEVRKLAEKTMKATQEVGQYISNIQEEVNKNMESVDHTVDSVKGATKQANESGKQLRKIVELIKQASEQVQAIATATEEQSTASEEINKNIEEINRISKETAGVMNQSAQAITDLSKQTQKLQSLVDKLQAGSQNN